MSEERNNYDSEKEVKNDVKNNIDTLVSQSKAITVSQGRRNLPNIK